MRNEKERISPPKEGGSPLICEESESWLTTTMRQRRWSFSSTFGSQRDQKQNNTHIGMKKLN